MMNRIQSIRGMPDILPKDTPLWQNFEAHWLKLMAQYGYEEIRLPVLEATALFKRSIGEVTDIVEKEMFTFSDREGDSMTLRPEGTAGCVRAGLEHGLLHNQIQRWWYMGPMFRYERPQKGRYRQFQQVGVEAFGLSGPDIEVEQILMIARLWRQLDIAPLISLQINSLGGATSRNAYREALVAYFKKYFNDLDEDSKRRLDSNPLRILDSKNESMQNLIGDAPKADDYLESEDKAHFMAFQQMLKDVNIEYEVNPRLVRGLDYYNRTVYEWVTTKLGAQGTVCAGGRYDSLVEQLGGTPTPGVGFALGCERVMLLQKAHTEQNHSLADVYLISVGEKADRKAMGLAEEFRNADVNLKILVNCGGGSFKNQFKRADKSGAKLAFILGDNEVDAETIGVKFLREERLQLSLPWKDVRGFLNEYFI